MSYTEQEKQEALALYDELGSISKVINKLGFPSRQNMYTWIRKRNVEQKKRKKLPEGSFYIERGFIISLESLLPIVRARRIVLMLDLRRGFISLSLPKSPRSR